MLPLSSKIAFLLFAFVMLAIGWRGFYRIYARVHRGRPDSDLRFDHWPSRLWYALATTLTQRRTFRKRGAVSFFHSFIFYGFVFYLLVNLVDAAGGFGLDPLDILRKLADGFGNPGVIATIVLDVSYVFLADVLSLLVLLGVIALVVRRFLLPARRDFSFNERTLLHQSVHRKSITRDSIIVSAFILFHVGSRAIGAGARIAAMPMDKFNAAGNDPLEPFGSLLAHLFTPGNSHAWQIFGYWGALGSVLAFLAYFPYTKHIHIFAAPLKYFFARPSKSGVLPLVDIDLETEEQNIGASRLEDLTWPRLLDAYACIQCNRCQDVCPATATGKSLSPAALEINKRMELNQLALATPEFETGATSPHTLLQFALTPEAAWACTTCGACMEVCPVQDEQMLDIIDIRRHQVMMEGEFPSQLQTAFRGMERNKNPWGINHEQRLAWADGLSVKTTDENPEPDVLYWVGCAASYDPQAQKTARAFVQLLDHAGVDFAVLGKKECCTGDTARRAGNELLYRQLADQNVSTLNQVRPRLVVASCPHCMNALGSEYRQIGGDFKVMHHTEYLESLLTSGKLEAARLPASITYHDPCYLGRHNDVYDAPRNLLKVLGNDFVELERTRSNSFCCGAGGAQFWKEEEAGAERISENRFKEVQRVLSDAASERTLAVGCPFCKSMLGSTPAKEEGTKIVIRDVAELLWEAVQQKAGKTVTQNAPASSFETVVPAVQPLLRPVAAASDNVPVVVSNVQEEPVAERRKWTPKISAQPSTPRPAAAAVPDIMPAPRAVSEIASPPAVERKKWSPKTAAAQASSTVAAVSPAPAVLPPDSPAAADIPDEPAAAPTVPTIERKKWQPKPKS